MVLTHNFCFVKSSLRVSLSHSFVAQLFQWNSRNRTIIPFVVDSVFIFLLLRHGVEHNELLVKIVFRTRPIDVQIWRWMDSNEPWDGYYEPHVWFWWIMEILIWLGRGERKQMRSPPSVLEEEGGRGLLILLRGAVKLWQVKLDSSLIPLNYFHVILYNSVSCTENNCKKE